MKRYSVEFKKAMVKKMASPGGSTPYYLEKEVGVTRSTLCRWLKEYGTLSSDTGDDMTQQKLTAKAKFKLVMEYEALKEERDKGVFLRTHGIYTADIVEWKLEMLDALDGKKPSSSGKTKGQITKEVKELKRELRRKEKALAETAALLVLKKKVEEIWGDPEDD